MDSILAILPPHTNVYPYRSFNESLSTLRSEAASFLNPESDAPSQLVVFTNLSIQTFTRDFEEPIRGIICNMIDSYYPDLEALIIKMKTGAHEVAHNTIGSVLTEKLTEMSHAYRGLIGTGQKTIIGTSSSSSSSSRIKEADLSYRPRQLPCGRSKQWPTLIAESGDSDSQQKLDNNAKWWISVSGGHVKLANTIVLSIGNGGRSISGSTSFWMMMTGLLMSIELQFQSLLMPLVYRSTMVLLLSLFACYSSGSQPSGNEEDIIFTADDMRYVAESIWEEQF